MLKPRYAISLDIASVYKVRARVPRHGWGWAIATIREWPRGGQIDVQSDFGNYAYAWTAIGDRTLREFLCGLNFDYFMNKAFPGYREFDEEKTIRTIKADIFQLVRDGRIDREIAHEWRDELDLCADTGSEHMFAERLMTHDWFSKLYDTYPPIEMRDSPQARAFWHGPWAALCSHWRAETAAIAA
ncbi:MAG: hypothetical protein F9K29_07865 [Hyphomicrobiaceae bacterium]|nr:MAG: hypothetical protein F9K29_07865 [Hyphomicrobiaceae bacterium]